jgi:methyl-accepting chemotaxis protein
VVISILQNIADILTEVRKGVSLLAKIDDEIKAFATSANTALSDTAASLKGVATNIQNIAADEANLLDQIKQLNASIGTADLSQESKDLLAGVLQQATDNAANLKATADATKTLADSVPDAVPAPVPTPQP